MKLFQLASDVRTTRVGWLQGRVQNWARNVTLYGCGGVDAAGKGSGVKVQGPGFRVQGSRCRVQELGFRAQCSGFRMQCSKFRS